MAVALTPRIRMMAICDGVRESKTEPGVFHLNGVRQGTSADTFPFVPAQLWLFFMMTSPRAGQFPCYVRITNDQNENVIYYSYIRPSPTFDLDGRPFCGRASIRCSFPEAGNYTVQVYFFQEHDADTLKGETPFFVARNVENL